MLLKPVPMPSKIFSFKNNVFVAELSDFGKTQFGRVYDDACDYGFTIISEKTGRPAVFALDREEHDNEGDLIALHFNCVSPNLKNLKAVLFND